jgi:nitroreductase
MLTAQEYKVDSIPAVMLVAYPDLIRAELDIPPDLLVLFGIALGYRDAQEPLNQLRTARRPLDEVVRIKGL